LIIVGGGKEKKFLESLVITLGISESVSFVGFCNDVSEYYTKSALLVLPSKWETFGMVLLEAMNYRMPCIAFSGHAADEIIENNYSGILVKERTPAALANAIVSIIGYENDLERMGNYGFKILQERYSIKKSVDSFEQLIFNFPNKLIDGQIA